MENQPFRLGKRYRYHEEYPYIPAPDPCAKVMINIEQGTIFRRTPYRWLLLILFYVVLYFIIASIFFTSYTVFNKTLSGEGPKYRMPQPGFSFEPALRTRLADCCSIDYYEYIAEQIGWYVDRIRKALTKYGPIPREYFGDCHHENEYGYRKRNPCFFLRINRMIGFSTVAIETADDLPMEAPLELRDYLRNSPAANLEKRIWISCDSKPQIRFNFFPDRFFNISYVDVEQKIIRYPTEEYIRLYGPENSLFFNDDDFHRIAAVQIEGIQINRQYYVKCLLWAKNIERDSKGKMGRGMVRFALQVRGHKTESIGE